MDIETHADSPSPSARAASAARAVAGTLRMAHALAETCGGIDLAGLEQEIGRLCAAALDLPPSEGRTLRPLLEAVLDELDELSACLALPPPVDAA